MPFPSRPWQMNAQMWLSPFAVRSSGRTGRSTGMYGAAFVDYQDGSVLTYHELPVVTPMTGSARPLACRASWRFDADRPLAFLHGRRPFASLRLRDVRLRLG